MCVSEPHSPRVCLSPLPSFILHCCSFFLLIYWYFFERTFCVSVFFIFPSDKTSLVEIFVSPWLPSTHSFHPCEVDKFASWMYAYLAQQFLCPSLLLNLFYREYALQTGLIYTLSLVTNTWHLPSRVCGLSGWMCWASASLEMTRKPRQSCSCGLEGGEFAVFCLFWSKSTPGCKRGIT